MNRQLLQDSRHEVKFVGPDITTNRLRGWVQTHAAGFRMAYPDRRVNNVYFDTYDYSAYWENLTGASERAKVRYRWYGDSKLPGDGALEIKGKRNSFGWKRVFPVESRPAQERTNWRQIRSQISKQIPDAARVWLDANPLPVLINSYHRSYFVSADSKIRVTLDTAQTVRDQRFRSFPNPSPAVNLPKLLIVEIKCARADRERASEVIQGIPIRVSRHSKYVTGVMAISEP